ncbi:MAG: hypothetical protein JF571_03675 [Asticcacaulis sp.]|nr:hypothetical protein [Asticcacaulis sp.]
MENVHAQGQLGGSLSLAVDRLDRALQALEERVRALNSGEPLPEYVPPATSAGSPDVQPLLDELAQVRAEKDQLAAVANDAFEALGAAAANIRTLLADEAA